MRSQSSLFRLTATTAIVGLAFSTLLPATGFAQSPLPPLQGEVIPAEAPRMADPPARVGRLAAVTGQVSFHGIAADRWDNASLNFPVTSGTALWTQPQASVDIGVTGDRVTLDQSTELDIAVLDDQRFAATLSQGQIFLLLPSLAPGETFTVTTPRGVVAIAAPGRYEIAAGDVQTPTRISVVEGEARVSGGDAQGSGTLQVAANQTILISGTDQFEPQLGPLQRDGFLTAQLARERPSLASGALPAPAVVARMTGGNDLTVYGTWTQTPDYGEIWYPQVAAGYVPYRDGHWAFVQPWGWTWIDAAPWGFAPFHYGRWVQIGGRWGWAPGGGVAAGSPGYERPVYAPALVTFFGIGAGVALAGATVGWCPLGWQEPYHPWYRASPIYLRNVNETSVRDATRIITANHVTMNDLANRGGATMVSARTMGLSQPIGHEARQFPEAEFANARPLTGRDSIAPATGADRRIVAPGPAIPGYANMRPGLGPNSRPPVPIEPRAAVPAPNVLPVPRPPVALIRPEPHPPGLPLDVRPGGSPQTVLREPPRLATPGLPLPMPRMVQPVHPYEPPHVVQQFRPPPSPNFAQQFHPAVPAPHPVPLPPPGHAPEKKQPS